MLKMMTITAARRMRIVSVGVVRFEMTLETLLKVSECLIKFKFEAN